jgi:curved DNA-binding protein CbpA
MAAPHDPYRALGVPRGATVADIKKAHRVLAKRYHPDATKGDSKRFLVVQEAYRVLSDPLLRREWDARHAPGPIRATAKAPTKRPEPKATRPARRAAAPAPEPSAGGPAGARPRSSRSYTWSASEVPWWEEGLRREGAKRPTRRRAAGAAGGAAEPSEASAPAAPDFEVYNRSSGAAWSMAARAYFRKGDSDLPSRGVFRQQGAQPLTGGKARAAAEAEARRAAATDDGRGGQVRGGEVRPRRQDRP